MTSRNNPKASQIASTSTPLVQLLSPTHLLPTQTTCDIYSLRHLILQRSGLPDVPSWIRPQAWSVLLHRIGSEKRDWQREDAKGRDEYYALLEDIMPDGDVSEESVYDPLLTQIEADLIRSRFNAFSFFQAGIPPSASCPLAPLPSGWAEEGGETSRLGSSSVGKVARRRSRRRHGLFNRLEDIRKHGYPTHEPQRTASHLVPPQAHKQPTTKRQISDLGEGETEDEDGFHSADEGLSPGLSSSPANPESDRRTNSILRMLFLYSLLNPSIGYVQGMVEVASVILWTLGSATGLPQSESNGEEDRASAEALEDGVSATAEAVAKAASSSSRAEPTTNPHFEADSLWCFSLLLGELRELWDFEGIDHSQAGLQISNARSTSADGVEDSGQRRTGEVGGMARTLRRLGGRLKWADEELWAALSNRGLSPSKPYYAFRWLATLLSTSLPLPSLMRVWDALLCESDASAAQSEAASSNPSQRGAPLGGKVEFLIDILTSLLMSHRRALLGILSRPDDPEEAGADVFEVCLTYLQNLPDDEITPVLEMATVLKHRRIAATLCGEDEPPVDERDGSGLGSTVKDRALSAFRGWTSATANTSTPARSFSGTSWLKGVSTPDSTNGTSAKASSVVDPASASKASPTALFSKYASALQASDAAAELSKRGTNLTARAMDRWAGSGSVTNGATSSPLARRTVSEALNVGDLPARRPSPQSPPVSNSPLPSTFSTRLGSVGANFRRTFSSNSTNGDLTAAAPVSASSHPALQWNQDSMPQFPLPDVMNSPEGRTEYAYVRPGSIILSPGSAPAGRATSTSPYAHSAQPSTPSHALRSAPAANGRLKEEWSFPSPGGSSTIQSREDRSHSLSSHHSNGQSRSAGPKPLLLAGAARVAHESNADDGHPHTPPVSKIVRKGPLAGGSSSPHLGRRSNRDGFGRSTSQAGSYASSQAGTSSTRSRSSVSQSEGGADSSPSPPAAEGQGLTASSSLQEALKTAGALPKLPSLANATKRPSGSGRSGENATSQGLTSSGGLGGLMGRAGQGTAPARAFGGGATSGRSAQSINGVTSVRPSTPPLLETASALDNTTPRPDMRTVASSSDIPLVPTEGRQVRRRGGPGGNHVRGKSSSSSIMTIGSVGSGANGSKRRSRRQLGSQDGLGDGLPRSTTFERLTLADNGSWSPSLEETPQAGRSRPSSRRRSQPLSPTADSTEQADFPTRYELTDEPVVLVRSSSSNIAEILADSSESPGEKALPPPPSPPAEVDADEPSPVTSGSLEPNTPVTGAPRLSQGARPASSSSSAFSSNGRSVVRGAKVRSKRSFKTGGAPPSPIDGAPYSPQYSVPKSAGGESGGGVLSPVAAASGEWAQSPSPLSPVAASYREMPAHEEASQENATYFNRKHTSEEAAPSSATIGRSRAATEDSLPHSSTRKNTSASTSSMSSRQYGHLHSASRTRVPADLPQDESDLESDGRPAARLEYANRMGSYEQDEAAQDSYEAPMGGSIDEAEDYRDNGRAGDADAIGNAFARFSKKGNYSPYIDEAAEEGGEVGNESVVIRDRAGGIKF
ncbi:hypothetical protein BCV69DRAFT_312677 [Microstroma glucosiphilum]|uniref:Rab-GAP TBC domain-containing protein n=1 Tax=Pseudomicrostroma glucosiphilum TaxID=1684307 RepID=A0A316U656_9BASI|nr:hypothetical protein BCV69DRAFT_312677 [Pseudomicrostroma glucosiphilum]PWN20726.1 hypothetical protein BCV69DRAFT_312677 [Pseudomicrostroma glucosiphilum]